MTYCLSSSCPKPEVQGQPQSCPSCGSALLLQGRYRALKLLGQGGFGRTFLAVDETTTAKNCCVIKQFFPQQHQGKDQAAQLFRQEAQRLKGLKHHPQIPDLLDYFEVDQQQYLIQAFVDGSDLYQSISARPGLPETEIIGLLQALLPVVQFMHEHQIIHRDIKPANIIRRDRDQTLFLVDLGAAKVATGTALAITGTVIGSAEYTAPEQTRGKATFASDIYSLGMTCLHLLTGVSPFNLYDVDEGRLAWKDYLKAPISDRLSQVLEGMTQEATGQRYRSASAVLQDLSQKQQPDRVASTTPTMIREFQPVEAKDFATSEKPVNPINLQPAGSLALSQPGASLANTNSSAAESSSITANRTAQVQVPPASLVTEQQPNLGRLIALFPFALMALWFSGGGNLQNSQAISSSGASPTASPSPTRSQSANSAATTPGQNYPPAILVNSIPAPAPVEIPPAPLSPPTLNASIPTQGSIDLTKLEPEFTLKTTGELTQSLHISRDGSRVISSTAAQDFAQRDRSGYVEAWNLYKREKDYQLPFPGRFKTMAIDDQDITLLTQSLPDDLVESGKGQMPAIQAWNAYDGKPQKISNQIQDGYLMAVGLWRVDTLELNVITHNGKTLTVQGQESGEVWLQKAVTDVGTWGTVVQNQFIASAGWNARDNFLNVTMLDASTGNVETNFATGYFGHANHLRLRAEQSLKLKFSPNEEQLYIWQEAESCGGSCLGIWDFKAADQPSSKTRKLTLPPVPIYDFFLGPYPGQIVLHLPARVGIDPQLWVWDIEKNQLVKKILLGNSNYPITESSELNSPVADSSYKIAIGGSQEVAPVKLSQDGKTLITGHLGEIKVWDFQTLLSQ